MLQTIIHDTPKMHYDIYMYKYVSTFKLLNFLFIRSQFVSKYVNKYEHNTENNRKSL